MIYMCLQFVLHIIPWYLFYLAMDLSADICNCSLRDYMTLMNTHGIDCNGLQYYASLMVNDISFHKVLDSLRWSFFHHSNYDNKLDRDNNTFVISLVCLSVGCRVMHQANHETVAVL